MAASTLMISLLFAAIVASAGAAGAANTALDDVCAVLGEYYVTPEACASALCHDPSPCAAASDAHAVAALAARLAAAKATAARDSVRAAAAAATTKKAGLPSCLQLYTGAAAALEWVAGSVAAGRYPGAREVLEAARYLPSGCDGAAVPPENSGFDTMVTVAHAVIASLSKGY